MAALQLSAGMAVQQLSAGMAALALEAGTAPNCRAMSRRWLHGPMNIITCAPAAADLSTFPHEGGDLPHCNEGGGRDPVHGGDEHGSGDPLPRGDENARGDPLEGGDESTRGEPLNGGALRQGDGNGASATTLILPLGADTLGWHGGAATLGRHGGAATLG